MLNVFEPTGATMIELDDDRHLCFVIINRYVLAGDLGARMGVWKEMEPLDWKDLKDQQ